MSDEEKAAAQDSAASFENWFAKPTTYDDYLG